MSAMATDSSEGMSDLEQEVANSIRQRQMEDGDPLEGLFCLTRQMESEPEEQFDGDCTILDFLAYKATESVFDWRSQADWSESDLPSALVTMTAEWRALLTHKWKGHRLNNQIAFRSRLLQFSLLFTHRLDRNKWREQHSVDEIKARNTARGQFWRHKTNHSPALRDIFDPDHQFPLPDAELDRNVEHLSSILGKPAESRISVHDKEGVMSLHCLLPLFVELTAARASLDDEWSISKDWLHLVGRFMLQAVLEDYLRLGAHGSEPFDTIFALGCPSVPSEENEPSDIQAMRRLFCSPGNGHEQIHGWAKLRRHYINQLLPDSPSTSHLEAMESAQYHHPYLEFEMQILEFLQSLHGDVVKPDLVQVEQGRITINGTELPDEESKAMIQRMRLDG